MVFGLGPVLRSELITTARRGRYYLARAIYGSVLLWLLCSGFMTWEARHPGGATPEDLRLFSESMFIAFAQAQLVALLCLVPALVAGVIADEHQRKTLHDLLASRLSSLEIVPGKLGARLLHVDTFVALGLPVVCLLALYGGLDPVKVFYVYFGTFTTVQAVAGPSIFISVLACRPRDAILAAYALEALWLLGAPAIDEFSRHLAGALWWVWPVNNMVLLTNPLILLDRMTGRFGSFRYDSGNRPGWEFLGNWIPGLGPFAAMFWAMAGLQMLAGWISLALAIAGLRPLHGSSWPGAELRTGWWTRLRTRAQAIARHRAAAAVARNELLAVRARRPACGDDPMLWKERHAALGGGLKWLGGRPVAVFYGLLRGCYLLDVTYEAVAASLRGQGARVSIRELNGAIRMASAALTALGLLAVATCSAVSITGEREQDTWTSLATTLLTPEEVIRAKQFGAVWSARRIGLGLLVTWALGLLLGALHPLAVLLAAGLGVLAAWFAAAVGVSASSFARNSARALASTFITLLVLLSSCPFSLAGTRFSPAEFAALWSDGSPPVSPPLALTPAAPAIVIVITVGYAAIAVALTTWSIRRLRTTWGRMSGA